MGEITRYIFYSPCSKLDDWSLHICSNASTARAASFLCELPRGGGEGNRLVWCCYGREGIKWVASLTHTPDSPQWTRCEHHHSGTDCAGLILAEMVCWLWHQQPEERIQLQSNFNNSVPGPAPVLAHGQHFTHIVITQQIHKAPLIIIITTPIM